MGSKVGYPKIEITRPMFSFMKPRRWTTITPDTIVTIWIKLLIPKMDGLLLAVTSACQWYSGFDPYIPILTGWWFGTFCIFPYIGNFIVPTDFHILQRGKYTTNQWTHHSFPVEIAISWGDIFCISTNIPDICYITLLVKHWLLGG